MRDYGQIVTKIKSTPWLITPDALQTILLMVDQRITSGKLTEEEIEARLEAAELRNGHRNGNSAEDGPTVEKGVGLLTLMGPIFGKANMMTELSGATSLEAFKNDLSALVNDDSVHSILMEIDSPGGTSDLVSETAAMIRSARDVKPIYGISNTDAGSAAYWLGSQASKLYVTPSGSVGSVGAYTVHEDQSVKDQKDGVRYTFISAGPYKTEGNPHEQLTQEGRQYREKVINELYAEFVDGIALGRNVSVDHIKENYGGGRMVTANDAMKAGMVDGILTYDALAETLVSQPKQQPVNIMVGGKAIASAVISGGELKMASTFGLSDSTNTRLVEALEGAHIESKEWEHSEPGRGSPPPPRTDQDGHDDPAIVNKWRRETPHDIPADEESLPRLEGGSTVSETTIDELRTLLGLDAEGDVVTAVKAVQAEQAEFKAALNTNTETVRFKEQFPGMYEEHMARIDKGRKTDALAFAQDNSKFKRSVGEELKDTKVGLSALAMDTVAEAHVKFAAGVGTLEDFEGAITAITQGGMLEYGENGSSQSRDLPDIDLNSPMGIANSRKLFASEVSRVKVNNPEMDDNQAIAKAAEEHPELAEAYMVALPG